MAIKLSLIRSWCLFFALLFSFAAYAQKSNAEKDKDKKNEISPEKLVEYEGRVRSLVSFMQFMFNTLGEPETTTREKETIINGSYAKIFKDKEVQIEDDLIEKRDLWVNKNVQAYLKDIDFFYKKVVFEYEISSIAHRVADDGTIFFTVTANRKITGTNLEGETINNNLPRYIEMALDTEQEDLKIISIYTSQANEAEALRDWWNQLPAEWLAVFNQYVTIPLGDSISNTQLYTLMGMEVLDISNNETITDIEPISRLMKLKTFKCANTNISNLFPLRSLTNLEVLDCSNTPVQDLLALTYATNLRELNVSNTKITKIDVLSVMTKLEKLDISITGVSELNVFNNMEENVLKEVRMSKTKVASLAPFQNIVELQFLDASFTPITKLDGLEACENLERLDISNTQVSSLETLKNLKSLRVLAANNTKIADLKPLAQITPLERVYCDNTMVGQAQAQELTKQKKSVLVIYESAALESWWKQLSMEWKSIFKEASQLTFPNPTKEELAALSRIKTIDTKRQPIKTLNPLRIFESLTEIDASRAEINDLTPLRDLLSLEKLNVSHTKIDDLTPLQNLDKLKILNIEYTQVKDILPLQNLTNLDYIYADGAALQNTNVTAFLAKNPTTVVIYQTVTLNNWWTGLSVDWKDAFRKHVKADEMPTKEQLHNMVYLESINLDGMISIRDLQPLQMCVRLKELSLVKTSVNNLTPIRGLTTLRSLRFSDTPVSNLEPITTLRDLEQLIFENTPIDDLTPMGAFKKLKLLNCAGTQIATLKCLEPLRELTELSCNTTRIRNLNGLENLKKLQLLRCYNTRLNSRDINKFKTWNPRCEVIFY